jgi:hypothetical protein
VRADRTIWPSLRFQVFARFIGIHEMGLKDGRFRVCHGYN